MPRFRFRSTSPRESGKYDQDERRYFSIARGSALECAAIMDVFEALGAISQPEAAHAKSLLERAAGA